MRKEKKWGCLTAEYRDAMARTYGELEQQQLGSPPLANRGVRSPHRSPPARPRGVQLRGAATAPRVGVSASRGAPSPRSARLALQAARRAPSRSLGSSPRAGGANGGGDGGAENDSLTPKQLWEREWDDLLMSSQGARRLSGVGASGGLDSPFQPRCT